MLIINAHILTPGSVLDDGWLQFDGSLITAVGSGTPPDDDNILDAQGLTLAPGFIDLHVHGGSGYNVMDASEDSLKNMAASFVEHGVTAFLPTVWTDTADAMTNALHAIARLQHKPIDGATVLGAHLEGPYLNPDYCDPATHVRRTDRNEALDWLEIDVIRLLTLAPEFPENHWLIEECKRRDITVSAGHTNATYDEIAAALEMGLSQATHVFNDMRGFDPLEPGTVGAALARSGIRCELIADFVHCHPIAIRILWEAKGENSIILVTDADKPDGSSNLTMDTALRNFVDTLDIPLAVAWKSTSLNAARAIGLAHRKGRLEVGKDADMVLLDSDLTVRLTIVGGRTVYNNL
jgi:N-acetylglucosamine-6-phosphate deacetylase